MSTIALLPTGVLIGNEEGLLDDSRKKSVGNFAKVRVSTNSNLADCDSAGIADQPVH